MTLRSTFYCEVCGIIEVENDGDDEAHKVTVKHICNSILQEYKHEKREFGGNRDGIIIKGKAEILGRDGKFTEGIEMTDNRKIRINVKPKQEVKFVFDIRNDMKKEDIQIVGIQLGHPQPEYIMSKHPYTFGGSMHNLKKKSNVTEEVSVRFRPDDIGQYEMPIMFTFHKRTSQRNLIIVREMVVIAEENPVASKFSKTPYSKEPLKRVDYLVPCTRDPYLQEYKVPVLLKFLFAKGLKEAALETVASPEKRNQYRSILIETKAIINDGIQKDNYVAFFHHILWWEEVIAKINLRKYNMTDVALETKLDSRCRDEVFVLEVPGLAEKRPSLMRGDRVYLQPITDITKGFECIIKDIDDNYIHLSDLDYTFYQQHWPERRYNVRFVLSRLPTERAHVALTTVYSAGHESRLFPIVNASPPARQHCGRFWNELISKNTEQRSAVEHIVAGTSGKAPYIVFGPPGTGKTMTIVEAIIQLVVQNKNNRILVCTDSNMAADHIALMLLRYSKALNINYFLLRASSRVREWSCMPAELAPVSNGTSYENYQPVDNSQAAQYRIIVTTLLHSAKYASPASQDKHKLEVSHLFVDEAAQASEPHTLVPMAGLLARSGRLVLAGDPKQLGPVCISRDASDNGLGRSLLERLTQTCPLYRDNPNYITMLRKNFRNDPDILQLPNELFYNNELVPLAPMDPLSRVSVLGLERGDRAVVFHALHSREQRMGNAPSYFNDMELEMLKRYVTALIRNHGVQPKDIGVIAPYIRQVYKMKTWLVSQKYDQIEVGTVEAFQGKEKRVILVSTVRANCRLLDYDAKYGLGFLVDDKRFNVAVTRAKAKLIIIGNPICLTRDEKWRRYMTMCKELGCYYGVENQQLERNELLLTEIAKTRFDRCRITQALKEKREKRNKEESVRQ